MASRPWRKPLARKEVGHPGEVELRTKTKEDAIYTSVVDRAVGGSMVGGRGDWNAKIIAEFRKNHGRVGGYFEGAPLLLLHHTGARTGKRRINPLMYLKDGDRFVVFASKGGADTNPAWYHNLKAHPDVQIEVGDETVEVHAKELKGPERDRVFARQASLYPNFAQYQRQTKRRIPVIALIPRDV